MKTPSIWILLSLRSSLFWESAPLWSLRTWKIVSRRSKRRKSGSKTTVTLNCRSKYKKFRAWLLRKRRATMKKKIWSRKISPLVVVEAVVVALVEATAAVVEAPLVVAVVVP
jgi:hypothetical protein